MKSSVRSHCLIPLLFGESPLAELDPQFCSYLQELSSKVSNVTTCVSIHSKEIIVHVNI